ncbi:hypothetical protein PLICRDRAFT_58528 [Plicaturopsis crispa FD-325 SS-3]|uniref:Zn(2)-C6 fungal-type domain-containing protein n=1 Tax=Plicaturopsis crispa FD-325 SS-3 TaxID=944288 RepID=A0A0C9SQ14_PLICR|nr:hypothetical protein PLICRDRAFT_58528 [Plicaturopsis crispa FD-325 SS-3]
MEFYLYQGSSPYYHGEGTNFAQHEQFVSSPYQYPLHLKRADAFMEPCHNGGKSRNYSSMADPSFAAQTFALFSTPVLMSEEDAEFYRLYSQPVYIPDNDPADVEGLVDDQHNQLRYEFLLSERRAHNDFNTSPPPPATIDHSSSSLTPQNPPILQHAPVHTPYASDGTLNSQGTAWNIEPCCPPVACPPAVGCNEETIPMPPHMIVASQQRNAEQCAEHAVDIHGEPLMGSLQLPEGMQRVHYLNAGGPLLSQFGWAAFTSSLADMRHDHQQPIKAENCDPADVHISDNKNMLPMAECSTSPRDHHASRNGRKSKSSPMRRPSCSASPRHLSPLPRLRVLVKKPMLACLFCRGRKIACRPPAPESKDKSCNQCLRRNLTCEYPKESRRGMRKHKEDSTKDAVSKDATNDATNDAPLSPNADGTASLDPPLSDTAVASDPLISVDKGIGSG